MRFLASADKDATPAEVLEFAEAGSRLLVAAVHTAPAHTRAYHPTGLADPEGFAAMGCVEALLHGHDIARGLGVPLDPDRGTCRAVLTRLFPDTPEDLASTDPWKTLQWATGRSGLPGHQQLQHWRWHGAPLDEMPLERDVTLVRAGLDVE